MTAPRPSRRRELAHRRNGAELIVGLDEVGRGPLAGPLVSAAVALPLTQRPAWLRELRDSKQLTAKQRARLAPLIQSESPHCAIGWVAAHELDTLGMTAALRLCMRRALAQLERRPDIVLADGRDDLRLPDPTEMIIKGDATVASIAAASIVAKAARDRWMVELDVRYPQYGFARHKGYGTAAHLRALREHGPCPEHRRRFAPVADLLAAQQARLGLDAAAS